jgi:uncharacterized protein YcnI
MVILRSLALIGGLTVAGAASAHVVAEPGAGPAGSYQVLRFSVGHGCGAVATTALRIDIPPGVTTARPQAKPGWTLDMARSGDLVTAITWRGELPYDQLEEFLIQVKLPATPGRIAFPTIQTCGERVSRWVEVGPPGGPRPEHPAPVVVVTPATPAPDAGHDHQH